MAFSTNHIDFAPTYRHEYCAISWLETLIINLLSKNIGAQRRYLTTINQR